MKQKKIIVMLCVMAVCFGLIYQTGYALGSEVDTTEVTEPLNNLYTILASVVSIGGGIYLLFSIVSMAANWQSHDTAQQVQGIMKCITALVICVAPWLVPLLVPGI